MNIDAILTFTFMRSFHECKDFHGLIGAYWNWAALEKLGYLDRYTFITHVFIIGGNNTFNGNAMAIYSGNRNAFFPKHGATVFDRSLFNPSISCNSAIPPGAGNRFRNRG